MTDDTKELWAWMTEYPDGTVGIVGAMIGFTHTPLIGRNHKTILHFKYVAEQHRIVSGQRVWLRRFHNYIDDEDLP